MAPKKVKEIGQCWKEEWRKKMKKINGRERHFNGTILQIESKFIRNHLLHNDPFHLHLYVQNCHFLSFPCSHKC
jgi:hypothetical protein